MNKSVYVIRWNDETEKQSGIIGIFESQEQAKMFFKVLMNECSTRTKDYFIERHYLNEVYTACDFTVDNITLR